MSLKVGVIGAGFMGENHIRLISTIYGVKLVGIFDPNNERANELAQKYRTTAFSSIDALLAEAEAIVLVSPTSTHFALAKQCLEAGKHLLVEKPLASTSAEALELVSLAKEKNLRLAVGHLERFNPAFVELVKLVRKEKVLGIDLKRLSPFPERIGDADVIQDVMIHDLDLLLALLPKDEIESLKAEGEKVKTKVFDRVVATIYFRSGIIAKVEANRVFGSKTRKIVVATDHWLFDADLLTKQLFLRNLIRHVPSVHHTKKTDQLLEELNNFFQAIKKGSPLLVDGSAGYKALKLAEEVKKACF